MESTRNEYNESECMLNFTINYVSTNEENTAEHVRMAVQNVTLLQENLALRGRIAELESDNARLTALLEKQCTTGTVRKFTLVEIANYCKGCVEWADAKSIVAMLNKLLRHTATENDSALVDSIEEEFIGRKYGTNISNNFNAPVGQVIE